MLTSPNLRSPTYWLTTRSPRVERELALSYLDTLMRAQEDTELRRFGEREQRFL